MVKMEVLTCFRSINRLKPERSKSLNDEKSKETYSSSGPFRKTIASDSALKSFFKGVSEIGFEFCGKEGAKPALT